MQFSARSSGIRLSLPEGLLDHSRNDIRICWSPYLGRGPSKLIQKIGNPAHRIVFRSRQSERYFRLNIMPDHMDGRALGFRRTPLTPALPDYSLFERSTRHGRRYNT